MFHLHTISFFSHQAYFAERYFQYFDKDKSGEIELEEFVGCLQDVLQQDQEGKLRFLFQLFDDNGECIDDDVIKWIHDAIFAYFPNCSQPNSSQLWIFDGVASDKNILKMVFFV